jgi:hypothetical protein
MIAKSVDRVPSQTDARVNEEIRKRTEASIAFYSDHPSLIPQRLAQLDREWDIERMLETGSSAISLFGLTMGLLRSRRWLSVPLVVQGFFLQHALQGWAPPLPILRRLGFRTVEEIDGERYGLLHLVPEHGSVRSPRRHGRMKH